MSATTFSIASGVTQTSGPTTGTTTSGVSLYIVSVSGTDVFDVTLQGAIDTFEWFDLPVEVIQDDTLQKTYRVSSTPVLKMRLNVNSNSGSITSNALALS